MEILDRLKALEGKIDNLSLQGNVSLSDHASGIRSAVFETSETMTTNGLVATSSALDLDGDSVIYAAASFPATSPPMASPPLYDYCSSVHGLLAWPIVREELSRAVLPSLFMLEDTTMGQLDEFVLGPHRELALPTFGLSNMPSSVAMEAPMLGTCTPPVLSHLGHSLNWDTAHSLSAAFFESFNLLYPIVDRHGFVSTILPVVLTNGFDDRIETTLAYLVLALGEVAIAGTQGAPVDTSRPPTSGIRGGSKRQPPGLGFFNQARRGMGFHLTGCSLENVQIFALAGIFYETCFHHRDFWRMTATASWACQALVMNHAKVLTQPQHDIVKRVFWHCSIMETFLELESGTATTGLQKYEAHVSVPEFDVPLTEEDHESNQVSHFQEHFASQIVLRRLATEFNAVLASMSPTATSHATGATPSPHHNYSSMPEAIKSIAAQLDHWRETLLPIHLHWPESDPESFPGRSQTPSEQSHSRSPTSMTPTTTATTRSSTSSSNSPGPHPMFTTHLAVAAQQQPPPYRYATDIQVALLRTRYYHTKHLIHRPFFFKALHHPHALTQEDADGVATCLRACLRWPIAMAPTCTRKRLVPCVFFWTQNLLGVLLVLWLSDKVPILRRIRERLCGPRFELEACETVALAVEWIRDLREVDAAAGWAWEIVKGLYGLEE